MSILKVLFDGGNLDVWALFSCHFSILKLCTLSSQAIKVPIFVLVHLMIDYNDLGRSKGHMILF